MSAVSDPFVVACIPIRNRAWIVERQLAAFQAQRFERMVGFYLAGDCEDDTLGRLARRPAVTVEVFDTGCPAWHRSREPRYSLNDHANLALVYNRMIDRALELWPQATHLWLCDSDVVPEPDCLRLLLEADKDVISAVVALGPEGPWNFMCEENPVSKEAERSGTEETLLELVRYPFPVTFLSACTLVKREVLETLTRVTGYFDSSNVDMKTRDGCRFAPHPHSHDFPFVASLRAAGYYLWVHPLARTAHHISETEVYR
jgi:hypothetical protein